MPKCEFCEKPAGGTADLEDEDTAFEVYCCWKCAHDNGLDWWPLGDWDEADAPD